MMYNRIKRITSAKQHKIINILMLSIAEETGKFTYEIN